ncbi:hypothetical protein M0804_010477 [Polistes exclamans]|nr:hypothetical protein M0804_010477 [Polistes exclamans]
MCSLQIVTTWRTARSVTPLGVVGVVAAVAVDPSPPLSNTYASPKADFTMCYVDSIPFDYGQHPGSTDSTRGIRNPRADGGGGGGGGALAAYTSPGCRRTHNL